MLASAARCGWNAAREIELLDMSLPSRRPADESDVALLAVRLLDATPPSGPPAATCAGILVRYAAALQRPPASCWACMALAGIPSAGTLVSSIAVPTTGGLRLLPPPDSTGGLRLLAVAAMAAADSAAAAMPVTTGTGQASGTGWPGTTVGRPLTEREPSVSARARGGA